MRAFLYRGAVMAVFLGVVLGGVWLFQSGALKKLSQAGGGSERTLAAVDVGGYTFQYPDDWTEIAKASLPRESTGGATQGQVVAGVCPAGDTRPDGKTSCIPGVDVTYVLFQEGQGLPPFADLETSFDQSFGKAFAGFKKVDATQAKAADGSPYLRYEFEFTYKKQTRSEVIGAFRRDDGGGAVVVAVGPKAQFTKYRKDVKSMLSQVEQPVEE